MACKLHVSVSVWEADMLARSKRVAERKESRGERGLGANKHEETNNQKEGTKKEKTKEGTKLAANPQI